MTTTLEGFNSYQKIKPDRIETDHTAEEISLEVGKGSVDLMIETTDSIGDETFAVAHLNRDQLWEHIHNCINALEGLA